MCKDIPLPMKTTTHYQPDTLFVPVNSDREVTSRDFITILGCPDWIGFWAAPPSHNVVVLRGDAINCAVLCRPTSTRIRNLSCEQCLNFLTTTGHVGKMCWEWKNLYLWDLLNADDAGI